MTWSPCWIVLLAGCGTPEPAAPRPAVDPLTFTWLVSSHEMGTKSSLSDEDALGTYGREVVIGAGYTTPWHGTCDQAKREQAKASLVEVTADVDISPAGRARVKQFGLQEKLVEYRLVCQYKASTPPLTIWLTGDRAMTCFGGVCYLLSH